MSSLAPTTLPQAKQARIPLAAIRPERVADLLVSIAPAKAVLDHATVLLTEMGSGWQMVKPILVNIHRDTDGSYLADDNLSVVYGSGDTPDSALADYAESLKESYELTARDAQAREPDLAQLELMQRYIIKQTSNEHRMTPSPADSALPPRPPTITRQIYGTPG